MVNEDPSRITRMFERILATTCIVSVLLSAGLGFALIWGSPSDLLGRLFLTSIVIFLASGSIFSVAATLRRRSHE